jgi:hypothetical protein
LLGVEHRLSALLREGEKESPSVAEAEGFLRCPLAFPGDRQQIGTQLPACLTRQDGHLRLLLAKTTSPILLG